MGKNAFGITLQRVVITAMLIALGLVLGLFMIGTNIWQISLAFVAKALIGAVGGPILSGIAAIVQDLLHGLVFSHYGYNWQFTFSAFVVGIIYGFFFYGKSLDIKRWRDWGYVFLAMLVIMLIDTVFFNTLWVSILYKIPFKVALLTRLPLLVGIVPRTIILMIILPILQRIPLIKKTL